MLPHQYRLSEVEVGSTLLAVAVVFLASSVLELWVVEAFCC